MTENKQVSDTRELQFGNDQSYCFENRRQEERRTEPSEGYTYISIVGWIDRREKLRRRNDP